MIVDSAGGMEKTYNRNEAGPTKQASPPCDKPPPAPAPARTPDRTADRAGDKPAERPPDRPAEQPTERAADKPADEPNVCFVCSVVGFTEHYRIRIKPDPQVLTHK